MGTCRSFAEVIDLDAQALHALLQGDGDDPERLWAAWALALRRADAAVAQLASAAKGEPSDGVRAQLALMLVGFGERALALELARRDPSALVRESAWRHLARTTSPDDAAEADALAAALARDPSAVVRAAILVELDANAATIVRERALAQIDDAEAKARLAAIDYVVKLRDPGLVAHLIARARVETVDALFARIVSACVTLVGAEATVDASSAWPTEASVRLLPALAACGPLTDSQISSLLERADARIDARLVELEARGAVALSLGSLLAIAARSGFFDEAALRSRLTACAALDAADTAAARALADRIERAYAEIGPTPIDAALARLDEPDSDDPWIEGMTLLPEIRRLTR